VTWGPLLVSTLLGLPACDHFSRPGPTKQDAAEPSGSAAVTRESEARPPALPALPVVNVPATFADLAARADPAVVFVKTVQRGRSGQRTIIGAGTGSAFVYDKTGLVLTNNHVIDGASDIRVVFGKSHEVDAEVVGRDAPTDIAVLRVEGSEHPAIPLGNSDRTRVGDWVVVIGNPFGLSHTVTAGIVSAKDRTGDDVQLGDSSGYYNFIQTDASIHPGNSGGPLLNTSGEVVGISTAIRAEADRIGFAIPINMVKELLPRLVKEGYIRRSFMGIHVASLLPADLSRLGLDDANGALVRLVVPGGPAEKAGLALDDVVVNFEGHAIASPERLRWLVSLAGVGVEATLKVRRGKQVLTRKVTLGELPKSPEREAHRQFRLP
jgi:serine protease Do